MLYGRKSTQLPQYLAEMLEQDGGCNRKVICTQPRKVSATSLAERVSEEWGTGCKTALGSVVGYRVGAMSKRSKKHGKIEYVTEGTFLATLLQIFGNEKGDNHSPSQADPLAGIGAVVVDEAHERSTTCDLILGMLKMHAPKKWPELKIIVTSATLDSQLFSRYFFDAPVLQIPGRMYPVEVQYLPLEGKDNYTDQVVKTALDVHRSTGGDSGDILCFLTGQEEAEHAKSKFASLCAKLKYGPAVPLALYGRQQPAEQQLVFNKAPAGTRKVIFATDVAETGVTIDGVRHIVDSGLCKESRYDSKRHVTVLSVQTICQSSAIQRKGRAGRTAPGTCYRLYSEDEFDALEVSKAPEVLSRPLQLTVISLLSMGIDPLHFEWVQAPDREGIQQAINELGYLGALVMPGPDSIQTVPELTELGRLIADLQVEPGMARMVYHGCRLGLGEAACTLSGIMSVASNFYYRGSMNDTDSRAAADAKHLTFCSEAGDMVAMYGAFCEWEALMNAYIVAPATPAAGKASSFNDESTVDDDECNIEKELLVISSEVNQKEDEYSKAGELDQEIDGLSALFATLSSGGDRGIANPDDKSEITAATSSQMDDDDDMSVISALSNETSNAFVEQKKNRFAASNQAKLWCRDNFLNNKSLSIAMSFKNDIMRLLQKFNSGSLWRVLPDGTSTDQLAKPSATDIQRLVVKGLFLNVSIQTNELSGYEVLRNDAPTVGSIHPGSSLMKLAKNKQSIASGAGHADGHGSLSKFIVFHTMLTTSRTFLNVITPVEELWIQEESPAFYNNVVLPNQARARCARLLIEGLRLNTSQALLGKYNDKKQDLEKKLNCSIQYDFSRSALEVWCTPGDLDNVQQVLEEQIQHVKRNFLEEVEEIVVCGGTRAVFGAGGLVKCLLFRDQYVTLNIGGLPLNTESSEFRAYLSQTFGAVRSLDVTYPSGAATVEGYAFAKVTFEQPGDAANALEKLHGEIWKSNKLSTSRGGIRASSLTSVTSTAQVVMSWALNASQGKATADFTTAKAANALLQTCLKTNGLNCPVLQGLGTQVHIRAVCQKVGTAKPPLLFPINGPKHSSPLFRVSIGGLYSHVDEQDLEGAFRQLENLLLNDFTCPVRVNVYRSNGPVVGGIQDQSSLSNQTAELHDMIPLSDKLVSATSFFGSGSNSSRAGFYLQYDSAATTAHVQSAWQHQVEEMKRVDQRSKTGEPSWLKFGQPIRLQQKFSTVVNIQTLLYNHFKNDIDSCLLKMNKQLNVTSRAAQPKKAVGSKFAEPKTTIFLNGTNEASLNLVVDALNEILTFTVFTPRNDEEKNVLFSPPGRHAMTAICNQKAFLYWDNAPRIVRVYSADKTAAAVTMQAMTKAITKLVKSLEIASFPVARNKRKQLLAAWRQLTNPIKNDVVEFNVNGLTLTVRAQPAALKRVIGWLDDGKFIQSSSKQAAVGAEEDLCSVCMCEVDQPHYYRACDHGGCTSCLAYQFSRLAEITVPAVCFSTDCGRCPIAWSDIKAVAAPEAVDVIKSAAVSKFVRENSAVVRCCPSPVCGQLLDVSVSVSPVTAKDQEELGGTVASCDQCKVEYCLFCSERDNKPRKAHQGDSCADNIEDGDVWRVHFQHIADNILTLHCPTCSAAFLDFDGCCAVACAGSGCGKYFCGLCLQPQANSSLSHAHVRMCPVNIGRDYFCSKQELDRVHRCTMVGKLRKYLESRVPKGDSKRKLLRNLEPLLADLNIFPKDIV